MVWKGHSGWLMSIALLGLGLNTSFFPCSLLWAQAHSKFAKIRSTSSLTVTGLRCELQTNPAGVQVAKPQLSWTPQASLSTLRGVRQSAYRILVASSAKLLHENKADLWDSGKTAGSETLNIVYAGVSLRSHSEYFWKVQVWDEKDHPSSWSTPAHWITGLMGQSDWQAHWIAAGPDPSSATENPQPLPIFRRSFQVKKQVAQAIVYVSGLGQCEMSLNGHPVSDRVLSPGWTNYRKTVLYSTYDVTSLLQHGENVVGVMLGNGMYNVPKSPGRYQKFVGSFGQPKLRLQLHLLFADGKETTILSDKSWKVTIGPIIFSSIYGGEDYDARREQFQWDMPGKDEAGWQNASEVEGPGGVMVAQQTTPIRAMRTYAPVKTTQPKPGVTVYDLGQNFSGWPQLSARGPAGAVVKITPGELLDNAGLVTQRSSGGPEYFTYTLKGRGVERWHPLFSYYGFRYLQVEIAQPESQKPEILSIEGQFVHSSASSVGEFATSDPLLDKIHRLIDFAIESNMQSVLTDCPTREKLGWLEQTHLIGRALFDGYDLYDLYAKMASDIRDAQLASGLVPEIAPEYVVFDQKYIDFRDSPEWGSASILSPWIAYQYSGDLHLLAAQYETMQRYIDYLGGRSSGYLLSHGLGDWYDIGPGEPGYSKLTSKAVTATGIYYQDLNTLRLIAHLLQRDDDAAKYTGLAEKVREAFNENFFHSDTNQYDRGSQTANAISLVVGLVPIEKREAVLANLVADIRNHGNHLTAGDIGFHYVLLALLQGGRSDVIYDMLSRTDAPSYGDQLAKGATSLTEAWDANPHSSQNHFMLGHAKEWFYEGLGGLHFDLSQPEGKQIVIYPRIVKGISFAEVNYKSIIGKISSRWTHSLRRGSLQVTIPANTSAEVYIPTAKSESILERGRTPEKVKGVRFLRKEATTTVYTLSSGQYEFQWRD